MNRIVEIGLQVRANLIAMLDQFESDETLTGLCAIASIAMMKSLRLHGIKADVVEGYCEGESHVWNVVDGAIVDITFTQFKPLADPVHVEISEALNYLSFAVWDSVQKAEDETWVSEVLLDWSKIIVVPRILCMEAAWNT